MTTYNTDINVLYKGKIIAANESINHYDYTVYKVRDLPAPMGKMVAAAEVLALPHNATSI